MFLTAISLRVGEYTIVSELFHIPITFLLQRIILIAFADNNYSVTVTRIWKRILQFYKQLRARHMHYKGTVYFSYVFVFLKREEV